jgi:hypothetical protein
VSAIGTGYPRAPRMLRGGLVRLDPVARTVIDVVVFQYNPDSVTRTIQPRAIGGEPGDRLEVLRLTGPPHETFKFDAEIDATDQLEQVGDQGVGPAAQKLIDAVASEGLLPTIAALERLVTPTASELLATDALFDRGMLEVAPMEAPLTVLVWGVRRVVPVLVTSLTITEEAFDPKLQPIRVKASVECKVLTSSDLPLQHLGGSLYIAYRQTVEQLAAMVTSSDVRPLGLEHLP